MILDPTHLLKLSRPELDDLFHKSEAGPIPDGDSRGFAVFAPGTWLCPLVRWMARDLFWQGKVFDAKNGRLINKVFCLSIPAIRAHVEKGPSWLDQRECIVLDYSKGSLVARKVRDEMREVAPGIYFGIVFWGKTRLPIDFMVDLRQPRRSRLGEMLLRYGLFLAAVAGILIWILW